MSKKKYKIGTFLFTVLSFNYAVYGDIVSAVLSLNVIICIDVICTAKETIAVQKLIIE